MHSFNKTRHANSHWYHVLGVRSNASRDEIKAAYRKMSLAWNPDRHIEDKNHATAKYSEIKHAYLVLMQAHPEEAGAPHRTSRLSEEHSPIRTTRPPLRRATTHHDLSSARSSEHPTRSSTTQYSPHHSATRLSVDNAQTRPPFTARSTSSTTMGSLFSSRHSSLESVTTAPSSPTLVLRDLPKFEPVPSHAPTTPASIIEVLNLNKPSPSVSINPSITSRRCDPMSPAGSKDSRTRPSETVPPTPITPKQEHQRLIPEVNYDRIPSYGPIAFARGFGTSKEWRYTLTLSLEELFHGKKCHFVITRHMLNKKTVDVPIEVEVPPGCEAERTITFYNMGHEYQKNKFQDIVFVIAQSDHDVFTRNNYDLVMSCTVPWTDTLRYQDGRCNVTGIDGQTLWVKVSCPKKRGRRGRQVIKNAGMPILRKNKVIGRGNLTVHWEVTPPPRASRWHAFKTVFRWTKRR